MYGYNYIFKSIITLDILKIIQSRNFKINEQENNNQPFYVINAESKWNAQITTSSVYKECLKSNQTSAIKSVLLVKLLSNLLSTTNTPLSK